MSETIQIKYKKIWPIFILTMAFLCLAAALAFTVKIVVIISAILQLLAGFLMLTKPIAEISNHEIRIKNLFGMTMKTYTLAGKLISVTRDGVFIENKKIVSGIIADIDPEAIKRLLP